MEEEQVIDDYCSAWSEEDGVKRESLLMKVLLPDVTYTDPTVETKSVQELSSYIGRILSKRPALKSIENQSDRYSSLFRPFFLAFRKD